MHDFPSRPIRLMTVDPGHFHAALVQKLAVPGIHPRVHVYAPLGRDLLLHLQRLVDFNSRERNPTLWELDVRSGNNYWERFLQEQPGNTVVLSGKNKPKIDRILASVQKGLNVLADKPWIVDASDYPKLEQVFREAALRDCVVYDMMTERHEITNILQQLLIRDTDIFGEFVPGSVDEPSLSLESVHHLKKRVAGGVLQRPVWWFDPTISGEGLADVGTHLADLALLMIAPGRAVQPSDVGIRDADHWPLMLSRQAFSAITQSEEFPESLRSWLVGDQLQYLGNGQATFTFAGKHVRIRTRWELEAEPGCGDRYEVIARGSRSRITVSHDPAFGTERVLSIQPNTLADVRNVREAVSAWCDQHRGVFPGLSAIVIDGSLHLHIPTALRRTHETLFSLVVQDYVRYFHAPRQMPPWEQSNLLTRYHITTQAVEIARKK